MIDVWVEGRKCRGLLDTGCSRSILSSKLGEMFSKRCVAARGVVMMNGAEQPCEQILGVNMEMQGAKISLNCLVSRILPGVDVLIGVDAVHALGGVKIDGEGRVAMMRGRTVDVAALVKDCSSKELTITDQDFLAVFEDGAWTVTWKWKDDVPPNLKNRVAEYEIRTDIKEAYEKELQTWIEEGWLQPFRGEAKGLVPLMAVEQKQKKKVRPVLDFREINQFIKCHTADSEVCTDRLREWRRKSSRAVLLDLRKAYLQLRVDASLWSFQTVRFKGEIYALTRLGFGLSVAPRIMAAVVNRVLSEDPEVRRGASSFVDDILVDEDVVSHEKVVELLHRFGLQVKEAVPLEGNRVLGLRISEENGKLLWRRDNQVESVPEAVSKREVFSICGQLCGHFPVAGWLRVACSFVKRCASEGSWDSAAPAQAVKLLNEVVGRVREQDPVRGEWHVGSSRRGRVWCDASSIALGVVLEIDGVVVEDASWLRKQADVHHINVSELDAVLKGVTLAVKWGLESLEVVTDSATVASWLSSMISQNERVRIRGNSEVLVKRRLNVLIDTAKECGLQISVIKVASSCNKADELTRVPKNWLSAVCGVSIEEGGEEATVRKSHLQHHFGVERILAIVRKEHPRAQFSRKLVGEVVKACAKCKSIDPAAVQWDHGSLGVESVWTRLACDVTHVNGKLYLSAIDCGPSRFTVWQELRSEGASEIASKLLQLFCGWGPPSELLLDNAASFRSEQVRNLCAQWNVALTFRCAHRPSGNGIVERCHRTIKRVAARSGRTVLESVFWYNFAPREALPPPHQVLFRHDWRSPALEPNHEDGNAKPSPWPMGREVYVRPGDARCTTRWLRGRVSGWRPPATVEVDGVPRHVSHLRPVHRSPASSCESSEESVVAPRPRRNRRPPVWMKDYTTWDASESDSSDDAGASRGRVS